MKTFLLSSLLMMSSLAFAGDRGNGGGVHLCDDGKIEMYDIYEGFTRHGLAYPQTEMSMLEHIERALAKADKFHPAYGISLRKKVKYLLNEGHLLLRTKLQMELIEDANILVTDVGCRYAQLANWDDFSNNVLVKKEYFDRLSNLSKAALYVHEAIYSLAREAGEWTSDNSRKTTAELLSTKASGFSNIDAWARRFGMITVVDEAKPASLEISGDNHLAVHFGDYNVFDPATKYKVVVDYDYSELKQKLVENQNALPIYKEKRDQLVKELERAILKKTKSQIEEKIRALDWQIKYVNDEIKAIASYSKTKREFPGSPTMYSVPNDRDYTFVKHVKIVVQLFINEELITTYVGPAPWGESYSTSFSQNRSK